MESRASDISFKLNNNLKEKHIRDVDITVYKDLFSQRT